MKALRESQANINGTSATDQTIYTTYQELKKALGPDTFDGSGDDKVQKTWVVNYKGYTYTIYDWKEYGFDVTDPVNIVNWHIGSRDTSLALDLEFVEELHKLVGKVIQ